MKPILTTAATCYLLGYVLGTVFCYQAWRTASGERYRLGRR